MNTNRTLSAEALGLAVIELYEAGLCLVLNGKALGIDEFGSEIHTTVERQRGLGDCVSPSRRYSTADLKRAMADDALRETEARSHVRTTEPTPGQLARDQTLAWSFSADLDDGPSEAEKVFGKAGSRSPAWLKEWRWFPYRHPGNLLKEVLLPTCVATALERRGVDDLNAMESCCQFAIASIHPRIPLRCYARSGETRWGSWNTDIPSSLRASYRELQNAALALDGTAEARSVYVGEAKKHALALLVAKRGVPSTSALEFAETVIAEGATNFSVDELI